MPLYDALKRVLADENAQRLSVKERRAFAESVLKLLLKDANSSSASVLSISLWTAVVNQMVESRWITVSDPIFVELSALDTQMAFARKELRSRTNSTLAASAQVGTPRARENMSPQESKAYRDLFKEELLLASIYGSRLSRALNRILVK